MQYRKENFVVKKTSQEYEILRYDANAIALYPVMNIKYMWFDLEPFDSFIKAVRYLKENYKDLI